MTEYRIESDFLGALELPKDCLYGIHTARALENFTISYRKIHPDLISAYGAVKLACAQVNTDLDCWIDEPSKSNAIELAATEMFNGLLSDWIVVDALQGGAGTSTNMNVNEVIANRALLILNRNPGEYQYLSPIEDVNRHQSTNDTYPTALKLAAIWLLRRLETELVALQEAFQAKEQEFAHIVKVGRTQLQDAVLTTLGRSFGAYAEAINRDRWRVYKCEERLRVVNLGGTAIGTGLAAPRQFIFRVVDRLRELTNIGFARAENLVECTQNADVFVEVSGILKACACSLLKIANDLRLLSSGPQAGLNEINLPQRQAGSSIMPGKVNPVIPEAVAQVAMQVIGNDTTIAIAAGTGNLELNQNLPLIAHCMLDNLLYLTNCCNLFRKFCIEGITANEDVCASNVHGSTAIITALISEIGYETADKLLKEASELNTSVLSLVKRREMITDEKLSALLSPEAICRLGSS